MHFLEIVHEYGGYMNISRKLRAPQKLSDVQSSLICWNNDLRKFLGGCTFAANRLTERMIACYFSFLTYLFKVVLKTQNSF